MTFTKSQRHTAYILMLKEYCPKPYNYSVGLCHLIFKVFGITNNGYSLTWIGGDFANTPNAGGSIFYVLENFPELSTKVDNSHIKGDYSQKGINIRKQLLQECIKETY